MSKRLTAKNLLREVRAIKRQAVKVLPSSDISWSDFQDMAKKYGLEIKTSRTGRDSFYNYISFPMPNGITFYMRHSKELNSPNYVSWSLGSPKQSNTHSVKNVRDMYAVMEKYLNLNENWWKDLGKDMRFVKKLAEDVASLLPRGWKASSVQSVWGIFAPGFFDRPMPKASSYPEAWEFYFPSPSYPGGYIDHGGGNYDSLDFDKKLTNDYKKDVSIIAKWIAREFKKHA